MKKNDWLLAAGITGLALMILAFQILTGKTDHAQVVVSIDGNPYGTYDLNTDQTVNINESNQIRIQDRTVRMIEADCPDQICVNHLAISRDGEMGSPDDRDALFFYNGVMEKLQEYFDDGTLVCTSGKLTFDPCILLLLEGDSFSDEK